MESFVKIKGNYNMGQKQGDWEEYEQPSSFKTKGKYWKDKKVGIWQIAREYGQVVENFNYDTGQKLLPNFYVSLHYPEKEMESGVQGTVIIRYKTSKECTLSDVVVLKSLSQALDNAAIQWVNRLLEFRKKYGDICEEKSETQELKFN